VRSLAVPKGRAFTGNIAVTLTLRVDMHDYYLPFFLRPTWRIRSSLLKNNERNVTFVSESRCIFNRDKCYVKWRCVHYVFSINCRLYHARNNISVIIFLKSLFWNLLFFWKKKEIITKLLEIAIREKEGRREGGCVIIYLWFSFYISIIYKIYYRIYHETKQFFNNIVSCSIFCVANGYFMWI